MDSLADLVGRLAADEERRKKDNSEYMDRLRRQANSRDRSSKKTMFAQLMLAHIEEVEAALVEPISPAVRPVVWTKNVSDCLRQIAAEEHRRMAGDAACERARR